MRLAIALGLILPSGACGPTVSSSEGTGTTAEQTTDGGETSTASMPSSSTPTTGASSVGSVGSEVSTSVTCDGPACSSSSDTGGLTSGGLDFGSGGPCAILAQDCPEGQKCVPQPPTWDPVCRPLDPQPVATGEPCKTEGSNDPCAAGLVCSDLIPDSGQCVPLCDGGQGCPDGRLCVGFNGVSFGLCLKACDPLMPDCAADEQCTSFSGALPITCVPAGGDAPFGSSCKTPPDCASGLLCQYGTGICEDDYCCTSLCDTKMPVCPDMLECMPVFEDPPPDLENVGSCVQPI